MINLIVHLWEKPEQEKEFRAYEDAALQIFKRYGGEVLEILRPERPLSSVPSPDEIQRLRMPSLETLDAFRNDAEWLSRASQRDACIQDTQIFICADDA